MKGRTVKKIPKSMAEMMFSEVITVEIEHNQKFCSEFWSKPEKTIESAIKKFEKNASKKVKKRKSYTVITTSHYQWDFSRSLDDIINSDLPKHAEEELGIVNIVMALEHQINYQLWLALERKLIKQSKNKQSIKSLFRAPSLRDKVGWVAMLMGGKSLEGKKRLFRDFCDLCEFRNYITHYKIMAKKDPRFEKFKGNAGLKRARKIVLEVDDYFATGLLGINFAKERKRVYKKVLEYLKKNKACPRIVLTPNK